MGFKVTDDQLYKGLRIDEGEKLKAYRDSKGIPTIGIGHNIQAHGGGSLGRSLGMGSTITAAESRQLFDEDIGRVKNQVTSIEGFDGMSPAQQYVVINLAFNMGIAGLKKFKCTLGALARGDSQAAAAGLQKSAWYGQVGSRAPRIVGMVANDRITGIG